VSSAQWPACHEVGVDGVPDGRWSEWFEGLHIHNQGDQTVLSGTLRDQSELHGVLDRRVIWAFPSSPCAAFRPGTR
jgi:hypothetical protein